MWINYTVSFFCFAAYTGGAILMFRNLDNLLNKKEQKFTTKIAICFSFVGMFIPVFNTVVGLIYYFKDEEV